MFSWILLCICIKISIFLPAFATIDCNESFLGRLGGGVIKSYNFPFNYRHNLTCTYRIHLPHGHDANGNSQICFTFHRFELENTTLFCSYDYLKFHRNDEKFDPKYCGGGWWQYGHSENEPMANVWSNDFCWIVKSDHFDVIFNSDDNENRSGFYATYQVYMDGYTQPPPVDGDPNTAPCGASEWTCFNRRCIPQGQVCNGADNCGDNSDESYVHARCGEENVMACDFFSQGGTDGYCGFTHEGWFRTNKPPSPYGPSGDHTNTTHGFYVYTDTHDRSAYLLSPEMTLPRNKEYCLSFWYYIYGSPPSAKLSVYVSRDQAYSRPEWSNIFTEDTGWRQAQVSFTTHAQLQVIFAAELDNKFSGVALDDITIFEGKCQGDDISCNFESGLCAWSSVNSIRHASGVLQGDILWQVNGFSRGASEPTSDSSSVDGGGDYIFMNHSNGVLSANSRALLYSPPVSQFSGSRQCLRFAYYMAGRDKNCCVLSVNLHLASDELSEDRWSKAADIRSSWQQAALQLDIGTPFQVVLEGLVSPRSEGLIAVDEIRLEDGECGETGASTCETGQYLCANGECINGVLKCDGNDDCGDMSDEDWHASCPTTTTTVRTTVTNAACAGDHICTGGDGTLSCIPDTWVCDGVVDCEHDGSDEHGCGGSSEQCANDLFRCGDGTCISASEVCDGQTHCADSSDEGPEANCPASTVLPPACQRNEFRCRSTYLCIPQSKTCDDVNDCSDGSDESKTYANCAAAAVKGSSGGVGAGGAVGIALAVLFLILAVLVVLLFLRRRKQKRTPREPPSRADTVSTIDSLRRGMVNGMHPPPYNQGDSLAITNAAADTSGAEDALPGGEEPPPPYDAVQKRERQATGLGHESEDNAQNDMLQQNWQATASVSALDVTDRRSTRSMPAAHGHQRRQRAGSLPHSRVHRANAAALDSVYVPRKYIPDPTVHGEPPAPFQRSQSMFTDRTRPLPRPPGTYTIYPPRSCGSAQDRIKLGVNAIRLQPRNYMNQGPHHEYDSDSTVTNTDHIYETLNLPSDSDNASRAGGSRNASRSGSIHALNHMNQQHLSVHSIDSAPNHFRNASTGSEVFESDSGVDSSTSFPNARSPQGFQQHPYGPGYRPSPSISDSNYGGSTSDQMSNTTARILYPKSAYNKQLSGQLRDRNSVLYRPGAQRLQNHNRSANPNFDRRRPNYSQNHSPNFMDESSPPSNCIPMQYQGSSHTPRNSTSNHLSVHSPPLQNSSQLNSTPIQTQNMPLSPAQTTHPHVSQSQQRTNYNPNKIQNHMRPPNAQQNISQNSSINLQNQRTPLGSHNVSSGRMTNNPVNNNAINNNKAMFKPVISSSEHGEPLLQSLSPHWQSPTHDRNDSAVSNNPRDLPTPDSQSNLIPSSNNSSFDQTQRSVIFLSDVDTDHMNPTCV